MENGQTIDNHNTLTHNLCSNQPGKSNQTLCSSQTRKVRTWSMVAISPNFCS